MDEGPPAPPPPPPPPVFVDPSAANRPMSTGKSEGTLLY